MRCYGERQSLGFARVEKMYRILDELVPMRSIVVPFWAHIKNPVR